MTMLHVYRNEAVDWFVAESAEDAMELYRQWLCDNRCLLDEDELTPFVQCSDDKVISIIPDENQTWTPIKKTAAEWARDQGKGFLCSENF